MSMSRQILPCWGAHSRMGHSTLYGYVEPFTGATVSLVVPRVDEDDTHESSGEEVHILPMEGPAFYGFQVLTEEEVRRRVASARAWKPRPLLASARAWKPRPLLAPPVEDAIEVTPTKSIGTRLRDFTPEELVALPEGSQFFDGEDFWTREGDEWVSSELRWSPVPDRLLGADWGQLSYVLTRIGPAVTPNNDEVP